MQTTCTNIAVNISAKNKYWKIPRISISTIWNTTSNFCIIFANRDIF